MQETLDTSCLFCWNRGINVTPCFHDISWSTLLLLQITIRHSCLRKISIYLFLISVFSLNFIFKSFASKTTCTFWSILWYPTWLCGLKIPPQNNVESIPVGKSRDLDKLFCNPVLNSSFASGLFCWFITHLCAVSLQCGHRWNEITPFIYIQIKKPGCV